MYFEFDDNTAVFIKNTPFIVSYSIESLDGVYGFSTPFVPLSFDAASPVTPVTPGYEDACSTTTKETLDKNDFLNAKNEILSGTKQLIIRNAKIVAGNGSFGITEEGELILDGSYLFYVKKSTAGYNDAKRIELTYSGLDCEPDGDFTIDREKKCIKYVNQSNKVQNIKATISSIFMEQIEEGRIKVKE